MSSIIESYETIPVPVDAISWTDERSEGAIYDALVATVGSTVRRITIAGFGPTASIYIINDDGSSVFVERGLVAIISAAKSVSVLSFAEFQQKYRAAARQS